MARAPTVQVRLDVPLGQFQEWRASVHDGADSATVHADPLRVAGPFTVAAAPTSAAGIVTASIHSRQEIALDHDDVLAFTDAANFVAIAVDLPGTDGEEVTLLPANFVTVRGILKAEIRSTED